jgi:hypothetical protein
MESHSACINHNRTCRYHTRECHIDTYTCQNNTRVCRNNKLRVQITLFRVEITALRDEITLRVLKLHTMLVIKTFIIVNNEFKYNLKEIFFFREEEGVTTPLTLYGSTPVCNLSELIRRTNFSNFSDHMRFVGKNSYGINCDLVIPIHVSCQSADGFLQGEVFTLSDHTGFTMPLYITKSVIGLL